VSNIILDAETARDIDDRVSRVLRDLGYPGPPLPLAEVRELLSLDRAFYASGDTDVLKETVHRLRVAGKQVLLRPSLLLDVVRKLELKALWVPDRRRILIDRELHSARQRWGEAHEIGHSLIPWHDQMLHGDPQRTLQQACELRLEAEANYAAGRLLFLRGEFRERLLSDPVSLASVRSLAKVFGNSVTATLWRAVEVLDRPAFGLISQHPRDPLPPDSPPVRHFIRSREFASHFPGITSDYLFALLSRFCFGRVGPIGQALSRLVKAGTLHRRGLFDYPRTNPRLKVVLSPDPEHVARAVARKRGGRIRHSGAAAANALGLSTQVPGKQVYLTDSSAGTVRLGKQTLTFKRVAPKRVASQDPVTSSVVQALHYVGKDGLTDGVVDRLRATLSEKDKKRLLKESRYVEGWIADAVKRVVQEKG
jgi:hypothetical protein